ncbi:MAG: hypothetical protein ACOCYB_09435, partial [Alkalispirochaeta sp.]
MQRPLHVAVRSVSSLFASLLSRGLGLHPDITVDETGVLTDGAPHGDSADVLILDFDVDRPADVQAARAIRARVS